MKKQKSKTMKLDELNPITIKLELEYTIHPSEYLPEDWEGTREDAIEWIKSDIAENLHSWINDRDIYNSLKEVD